VKYYNNSYSRKRSTHVQAVWKSVTVATGKNSSHEPA